jgi:hypothetical protein
MCVQGTAADHTAERYRYQQSNKSAHDVKSNFTSRFHRVIHIYIQSERHMPRLPHGFFWSGKTPLITDRSRIYV